jgi:hypothetical protein
VSVVQNSTERSTRMDIKYIGSVLVETGIDAPLPTERTCSGPRQNNRA